MNEPVCHQCKVNKVGLRVPMPTEIPACKNCPTKWFAEHPLPKPDSSKSELDQQLEDANIAAGDRMYDTGQR